MARVAVREGLLTTIDPAGEPRLIGGRCPACERLHFPATGTCPFCSGEPCVPVPLPGRGRLYVHTAVLKAPPGYRGRVPYGFGVVELPGGIRVVTRLAEADPSRLTAGDPVRLVLEDLFVNDEGDVVVGWTFTGEGAA